MASPIIFAPWISGGGLRLGCDVHGTLRHFGASMLNTPDPARGDPVGKGAHGRALVIVAGKYQAMAHITDVGGAAGQRRDEPT